MKHDRRLTSLEARMNASGRATCPDCGRVLNGGLPTVCIALPDNGRSKASCPEAPGVFSVPETAPTCSTCTGLVIHRPAERPARDVDDDARRAVDELLDDIGTP
jgi:ribosomal protein S27E